MLKKVIVLFIILLGSLSFISQSKYIKHNNITIAKINVDTIIPQIELLNIQNKKNKENENIFYDVNISIKLIESNIKEINTDKIKILINDAEININDFEIVKKESRFNELNYDIVIKRINKKQTIRVIIPEGIIIDSANNKNKEKIIEHKID